MSSTSSRIALKPRKKPAQSRSAETVQVILEAAARILEKRGFAGYTTNAVAELAGVSIGSLYQYFPSKEALTAALIERETSLLIGDVAAMERMTDGREGLLHLISAGVRHQMRRPALARLLDLEEQRLPLDEQVGQLSGILIAAIERQIERLPVRHPQDIREAAEDVLAIVKGIVDAAGERGETGSDGLEARVARAVFGYLGLPA